MTLSNGIVLRLTVILIVLFFVCISLSGCLDFDETSYSWVVGLGADADFSDIQTALDAAHSNDIIFIDAGDYFSPVIISKSVSILPRAGEVVLCNSMDNTPAITVLADNVVIHDIMICNSSMGLKILGDNGSFFSNYFINNSVGICLEQGSKHSVIYNNYFDNKININGSGSAALGIDKHMKSNIIGGMFVGGNFWSDYVGFDLDEDGFGDTHLPYRGNLQWQTGGDVLPLTTATRQMVVYVDDDFSENVSGWNIDHFSDLQHAIRATFDEGVIYLASGTYVGPVILNRTLNIFGENQTTTVISTPDDFGYGESLVEFNRPWCSIANVSILTSLSTTGRVGIDFESRQCQVEHVCIDGFDYGVRFMYSKGGNSIRSSTVVNCKTGIYSSYTYNNSILDNIIAVCSEYGIYLNAGSDRNFIDGNIISDSEYGIRVKGSTLNLLRDNIFSQNRQGVYFCCGAQNNTITLNRFLDSINWHAQDQYQNHWDFGEIGNYWDDYFGRDADGDGIGEKPYVISENYSSDYFPIVDQAKFFP